MSILVWLMIDFGHTKMYRHTGTTGTGVLGCGWDWIVHVQSFCHTTCTTK